jgi:myogenesis-regulating glycosidase
MERFKLAVSNGEPVNPPIWWIAPHDKIAQVVDDEFLLGDKILVAPVIVEGEEMGVLCVGGFIGG